MNIFICENSFEGIMSGIYDAWQSKLGHNNIKLLISHDYNMSLFCDYHYSKTDSMKTEKVTHAIKNKLNYKIYYMVYAASQSSDYNKADIIYRFLLLAFAHGNSVLEELHNPYVMPFFQLQRKVMNEAHYYKEFLRFSYIPNQILVSQFEPQNNVITLIGSHFLDRMPSENWMIIDTARKQALIHPQNYSYYLTELSDEESHQISEAMKHPDPYIRLWKDYFSIMGIQQRYNPKCQQTMLPLKYRKNMTEFK